MIQKCGILKYFLEILLQIKDAPIALEIPPFSFMKNATQNWSGMASNYWDGNLSQLLLDAHEPPRDPLPHDATDLPKRFHVCAPQATVG